MIISKRVVLAVGSVTAAAVLGTAGIAAATGSPSGTAPLAGIVAPAPSASAAPAPSGSGTTADKPAKDEKDRGGRLVGMGHRLHGEWVAKLKTGQIVTVVGVNGKVTASSATSVTVKAEDGFTATYAVNSETVVRGKAGGIKVGQYARVVGIKTSSGSLVARAVVTRAK